MLYIGAGEGTHGVFFPTRERVVAPRWTVCSFVRSPACSFARLLAGRGPWARCYAGPALRGPGATRAGHPAPSHRAQ